MNLRQLRALAEVVNQGLSISLAADALHTSQPGVSRQILELEEELGVDIFIRKSNRLAGITEPGEAMVQVAQRILCDIESMRTIAADYSSKDTGHLTIATTHTHACYILPQFIQRFSAAYPRVGLKLWQGTPAQCCEAVSLAEADIAIVTETAERFDSLVTLPAYKLPRCLVTPVGHPLLRGKNLTLRRITLGADKAYDVAQFVHDLRRRSVTPHIAIDGHITKTGKRRRTAVDRRTTRHAGYEVSQRCRKRIEEVFGWIKGSAGLAKVKLRGRARVDAAFTMALTAYNLVRLPKLLAASA